MARLINGMRITGPTYYLQFSLARFCSFTKKYYIIVVKKKYKLCIQPVECWIILVEFKLIFIQLNKIVNNIPVYITTDFYLYFIQHPTIRFIHIFYDYTVTGLTTSPRFNKMFFLPLITAFNQHSYNFSPATTPYTHLASTIPSFFCTTKSKYLNSSTKFISLLQVLVHDNVNFFFCRIQN